MSNNRLRAASGQDVTAPPARWNMGRAVVYTLTVTGDHRKGGPAAALSAHSAGAGTYVGGHHVPARSAFRCAVNNSMCVPHAKLEIQPDARAVVAHASAALKQGGALGPTRIPWGG